MARRKYGGFGGFFPCRGTIEGSAGEGIGDSSIWCRLYRAEKAEENEGDRRAPSGGGARRKVVMVGGIRRDESSISTTLSPNV